MPSSHHSFTGIDADSWVAFIDESESNQRLDPHVYLLAAVTVHCASLVAIRRRMADLRLDGQRKLHWAKESACRRMEIMTVLEGLDVLFGVVVHEGDPDASMERRRRKCLDRLLWELSRSGVAEIVLESREASQNKKDRDLMDALLARRRVPDRARVRHMAGALEPLLWMADCLAGAVVASRIGDPGYIKRLDGRIEIYYIGP